MTPNRPLHRLTMFASLALLASASALAAPPDPERGREINGPCAGCHGDLGQGGKRGEYPRIAGQPPAFIAEQLKAFRARKRINLPMFPYTQDRELPDEDIRDVAAYLAGIDLPTTPPDFKDGDDALTRLLAMEKVMIVPRVEGDIDHGRTIYQKECAGCHGTTGLGRDEFPRLVGQYTNYLMKQVDAYVKGERAHEEGDVGGILDRLKPAAIQDIVAYLTWLQGGKP
jgi:cytochrome c553